MSKYMVGNEDFFYDDEFLFDDEEYFCNNEQSYFAPDLMSELREKGFRVNEL